jgi:membrane protein required for colicin V production
MSLQLLDLILIGTMLVSGLLALSRGFTRETLSLIAWGAAALAAATAILSPDVMKIAKGYIQPEIVATVGVGASVFIVVLVITSLIGVKIADWVLDSAAGPFDRTLGFAYGLARGLLLVVVAYGFYIWLVPAEKREGWIKNAQSLSIIENTASVLISYLPPEISEDLLSKMAAASAQKAPVEGQEGYQAGQTRGLNQLIQGTDGSTTAPVLEPPKEPTFGGQSTTGQ